jgi:hypothetical protein
MTALGYKFVPFGQWVGVADSSERNSSEEDTGAMAIIKALSPFAWPLVAVIALVVLGRTGFKVPEVLKDLLPQLKSVSIAGFEFELGEVKELPIAVQGEVDLRKAGKADLIYDSTLGSFYQQIRDQSRLTYSVIDLGEGSEWLTSRLFILSIILGRMRGLELLVFVETSGHIRRRFVGSCAASVVRWRLAQQFPRMEAAVVRAESQAGQNQVWPAPATVIHQNFNVGVVNDEGRLEEKQNPEPTAPAAKLLKAFLSLIQASPPLQLSDWVELPSDPNTPKTAEHAQWITGLDAERILNGAIDPSALRLKDL